MKWEIDPSVVLLFLFHTIVDAVAKTYKRADFQDIA